MADYDIRGLEPEQFFALTPLRDDCIDAANRAGRSFDGFFPGWQLYSRVVRGDRIYDRGLAGWAVSLGRRVARAKTGSGHPLIAGRVRRNDWIMQASLDALTRVIKGAFPVSREVRAIQFSIDKETFTNLRNVLAGAMLLGFDNYVGELHFQLQSVRRDGKKYISAIRRGSGNRLYIDTDGAEISAAA